MPSYGAESRTTEKTETYDLAGILKGRLPESSTIALIGEPGTGTTVFCLHYIASTLLSGRRVIFVCFDYQPSFLTKYFDSFGFDVRSHIADGKLVVIDGYDVLCRKMGISKTYEIENLRSIQSEELISAFDEAAFTRYAPRLGEHISFVADSFTAMSPFLDVRSAYVVVAEICDRMRKGGHTALLVGHEGVLESNFVQTLTRFVDGVIRLRMRWPNKGLTREIFVEKLPFGAIEHPSVEFGISSQGIEIKNNGPPTEISMAKDSNEGARTKLGRESFAKSPESRVSTGVPQLDQVLDGGFPKGAFICIKGDVGSGTSTLCAQHTWSRLVSGGSVVYDCVDEAPDLVASRFRSYGWDIDPYIEKRRLLLADTFHFFAKDMRTADRGLKGIISRRRILDEFMRKQRESVSSIFGTVDVPVIIDSFTALAPHLDLKSSYVLARMVADSARRMNQTFLAVVRSSVVEANLLYACLGAADAIVEMKNVWLGRRLTRRMKFHKMSFTSIPPQSIEYEITREGIRLVSSRKG